MIIGRTSLLRLTIPLILLLTACGGGGTTPALGISGQLTFVYVYTKN